MLFDPPLPPPKAEDVSQLTYDQLAEYVRRSRSNLNPYQKEYESVLPLLKAELQARIPERNYACMKCNHRQHESHEIRASDGSLSSIFEREPAKYRALVCQRCKFTEFYQGSAHVAQQIVVSVLGG